MPLGVLLGHFWGTSGAPWCGLAALLGCSWVPSWLLGGPNLENVDFPLVLEGSGSPPTPGQPPETERAGATEGEGGGLKPSPGA